MRTIMLLALTALLAGCATEAERAAQAQRDVDEMVRVYGPACQRLGYQSDSNQWRDCVLRMDTKNNTERYPATMSCFGHPGFTQCTAF
ncbi:putative lipoprotein [Collimonas arenae]|uniref:Putative lipoprotein n=1 Tax=Collimonas arenae TaxID=279058 RepID=A0A127PNJ3_9BURK|nr:hypothetical protein [Collimonas arenae]AMO99380.1 putative lipoprotein [Collimonas arenae]AMP09282.1 putative lipoprotein [Collimonas arenae]